MKEQRIQRIRAVADNRQGNIVVILEDIHDPHNAAAILRTCDALGIQHVWFVFSEEKPYNPKRIGKASSSSANKWLDFRTYTSIADCIGQLRKDGYEILVTALTDRSASLLDYRAEDRKIAVVVGNEHRGVSETMLRHADTVLTIPMYGFVQSLNVSVAAAIVLWEITRQRRTSATGWKLTPDEHEKLLASFIDRANT